MDKIPTSQSCLKYVGRLLPSSYKQNDTGVLGMRWLWHTVCGRDHQHQPLLLRGSALRPGGWNYTAWPLQLGVGR